MTRVGMHEAKTNFSKLVAAVEAGEEVVLERRGRGRGALWWLSRSRSASRAELCGSMPDLWIADDFDELPDDIAEAFGMR